MTRDLAIKPSPQDPRGLDPALRRKYDVRGPRYTSYPPATHFGPVNLDQLLERWRERNFLEPDQGLSLYLHIPFCRRRCLFCGCHSIISRDPQQAANYVDTLSQEMQLVAETISPSRPVLQVALGGGTPSSLPSSQLDRLLGTIHARWKIGPQAELSAELDPRNSTTEKLDIFLDHGFSRFSLGIQDFSSQVIAALRPGQEKAPIGEIVDYLRTRGQQHINFDLIYGLPGQNTHTATLNVRRVLELSPSRIALYSYAHVPWLRPHQKAMESMQLISPREKAEIFLLMTDMLMQAGYVPIGMDHFALPDDPLARALADRSLRRNFMGYTTGRGLDVLGLGVSAISSVGSSYSQNEKDLAAYHAAVASGRLPILRGHLLSCDDIIRRELLMELFCTFHVDLDDLSRRFGLDPASYFAADLERLLPMQEDGLLSFDQHGIHVSPTGRFFIRNICMVFDRYLEADKNLRRYSRTV